MDGRICDDSMDDRNEDHCKDDNIDDGRIYDHSMDDRIDDHCMDDSLDDSMGDHSMDDSSMDDNKTGLASRYVWR